MATPKRERKARTRYEMRHYTKRNDENGEMVINKRVTGSLKDAMDRAFKRLGEDDSVLSVATITRISPNGARRSMGVYKRWP